MDNTFEIRAEVAKVNEELGLVFGWALISKEDGEEYWDLQGDHAGDQAILEASLDFAKNSRMAKEVHKGDDVGEYVFLMPLTADVAKAFEIETQKTGLMLGLKPDKEVLEKFADGTYGGFSIGGKVIESEKGPDAEQAEA